jgi:alcohol dehydrogenase class IV
MGYNRAMMLADPFSYELVLPPQIVFGWRKRRDIGNLAKSLGKRAFVVWGSRTLRASDVGKEIPECLRASGIDAIELTTALREPTVDDVDTATQQLLAHQVAPGDFVVAIGGGAALDLGKAIAAMATNRASHTVQDFLEGVGRGLQITEPPLPLIAVPTTAGTGSEATKNAVISSIDPPFKKSLRSNLMMPRIALVDPELTVSCPPEITAHSGMDAITQCVESYISRKAKPVTSALAAEGLRRALPELATAVQDGQSAAGRTAMSHAALLSGIALANSGLGMAHGVAAALGVTCGIAHGLACAVMLPVALRTNFTAADYRYAELEKLFDARQQDDKAAATAFVERIQRLCDQVGIPRRLSELGVSRETIPALVHGSRGNSMDGNPRALSDAELTEILESML